MQRVIQEVNGQLVVVVIDGNDNNALQKGGAGSGNFSHSGMIGRRGGSGGGGGGGGGAVGGKSKIDTTKKTANALDEFTNKGFVSQAQFGQKGVYTATTKPNKVPKIQSKLQSMGFQQYKDPMKVDSVTSYANDNNIKVHIGAPRDAFGGGQTVDLTISEAGGGLPFIPQGQ